VTIAQRLVTNCYARWDFQGRVGIVTGGSRGIGRATVLALAAAGARVIFNYRSASGDLNGLTAATERMPGSTVAIQADLVDPATPSRLVLEAIGQFGALDFIVNNAGTIADAPVFKMEETQWRQVIHTNLDAVFLLTRQALLELARSESGRIVNVASVAGFVGVPGQANYCAAKAGLIGFTRALAKEVARLGITVNAVAPGYVDTEMLAGANEERRKGWLQRIPLGRFATPDDVAQAICFLLSDSAAYITGQVIVVDGGLL